MSINAPRSRLVWLIGVAVVVAVAAAILLRFISPASRGGGSTGETPITSGIKVKSEGGHTDILVPPATLRASGIAVATLRATAAEPGISAFATAIQPQALLEQRRAILTAAAEMARTRAAAAAADIQTRRLRALNADNAIVSTRELETGQVAAAGERAGVQVASSQRALLAASAARQWGPVIAGWLINGSPRLDAVFAGRTLLLQIAPTHEVGGAIPRVAYLTLPQGGRLKAGTISPSPQADAQFQTRTFFALTPANSQLLPGMTVPARFPTGPTVQGVEVPASAVVRWNGTSYVYVVTGEGQFSRRAVSTDLPSSGGWIDATLAPGTRAVIAGAQLLLSEELRAADGGAAD